MDKILLFDSDTNLRGFPVPECFNLAWNYVVAGGVHQSVDGKLQRSDLPLCR